jgi:aminopeptidase N
MSETNSGTNKITWFKHTYPIASYLVALAVTNYQKWADTVLVNGKILNMASCFYPESFATYVSAENNVTKNALKIFSGLFGEYPFAKERYGHTQFGVGGGMEHQTNSFIGSSNHSLIAHELGHQWFGDKVTCGSWGDIWLNEGFATYTQALYTEVMFPEAHVPGLRTIINIVTSAPDGSVFVPDTTDEARIFSGRLTYYKGFYVVYMLRGVLGDSVFYRGVRRYLSDPALKYGYARTADLQRNLEQESGKDLSTFFQKWVYGEGYPNFQAEWSQNSNKWINIKLSQSTSHSSVAFYEMPVPIQLIGASQDTTIIVDHRYSGQEFSIDAGFDVDSISIDPTYWILSKVKTAVKKSGNSTLNEVRIYPNPAPQNLTISINNPTDQKLQLQLYTAAGALVYQDQIATPGKDEVLSIPISRYPRGVYLLRIRSEKNINILRKIIH